jgi:formate-dependent nitrite reductase membrane component NrfD
LIVEEPLLDTLIVLYIFLGGAAAGSFFIMSTWSLAFYRHEHSYTYHMKRAFASLQTRCYTISLIILVFSIFCLIGDLGSPERILLLFAKPHLTVITFGSYALFVELLIGALLAAARFFDLPAIGGRMRKALELLCCIVSIAIMVYTGIFLASNTSVPFWNSWTLVMLFLFSSLSAGISIVLLIDYFIKDQTLLLRAAKPLQRAHVILLCLQALSLAAFVAIAFINPAAHKSIVLLTSQDMLSTALIGAVGMGIIAPALLEIYTLRTRECRTIPVSDAVCLLGGLCLRYVIVFCGVH